MDERYKGQKWLKMEAGDAVVFQLSEYQDVEGEERWQRWDNAERKFILGENGEKGYQKTVIRLIKVKDAIYCNQFNAMLEKEFQHILQVVKMMRANPLEMKFELKRKGVGKETRYSVVIDPNFVNAGVEEGNKKYNVIPEKRAVEAPNKPVEPRKEAGSSNAQIPNLYDI